MFFRDESQKARALRALLAQVELSHLLSDEGPAPEARRLREEGYGNLTTDQGLVLGVALALWDGEGGPTVRELKQLSETNFIAVAALLKGVESGPEEVDRWITGVRAGPAPGEASA